MSNRLFQQARAAVHKVEAPDTNQNVSKAIDTATNELQSAFANATNAEREQLHELQQRLESVKSQYK